jgi:predicted Zn-dependent protease
MRNEAELAAILGHEFGHFESRHSLSRFQAMRRGTDTLAWGALLASMAPSYDTRRTYENLEISVYGSLFRYSRDNEREADLLGLGYLNKSSLRPQAASEVWQNLIGEIEASAISRGLKKPRFDTVAFTASHPPESERAGYLAALAEPTGASRDDGALRYREALSAWLPVFLDDQIKLNDFGGSEYIITKLAENGWNPSLWFARAELYRTRGHQRDLVNAVQFYSNALALDGNIPAAYRGLGLSLIKTGDQSGGQAALTKYLTLKPNADDAKMITLLLPKEPAQ